MWFMQASRSSFGTPSADNRVENVRRRSCGVGGSAFHELLLGPVNFSLSARRCIAVVSV